MPRLIALCLILAACAAPAPRIVAGFRTQATPIWSSAAFDSRRLAGQWQQTAQFTPDGAAACRADGVQIAPDGGIAGTLCFGSENRAVTGTISAAGPGRFTLPGVAEPVWVLWADEGYRTLALGTPNGRFGLMLERGKDPTPADRMRAAREIFDWNGYQLTFLRGL